MELVVAIAVVVVLAALAGFVALRGRRDGPRSARELRRALLVNPRDIDGMSAAMEQALKLPKSDARQRMAILRTVVRRHDVYEWADHFLEALRG